MPSLVGVAGLCGAGKSTAIEYLTSISETVKVYLGKFVLDEVRKRGLEETRESEKYVRIDLRQKFGPAALALLAADDILRLLETGKSVLVDSIYNISEYEFLSRHCDYGSRLLVIEASYEIRCQRLATRRDRPFTADQVRERDHIELTKIGTADVLAAAHERIKNEDSLVEFKEALSRFAADVFKPRVN